MGLNEAETRLRLIDPAIHARGWTEDLIRREETLGTIEIVDGQPRRRTHGRTDYTMRVKATPTAHPVAVAILEAKDEEKHPAYGLDQAKVYQAKAKRLNVPFVIATNGHQWVLFDRRSATTTPLPRPMAEFPTPDDLRAAYEEATEISLTAPAAKPLITPYRGGEAARRYYQDAAIRAVLEKLARGENRALLSLATGSGKTFIAVNLLRRIADAGQLRRALFLCDRDELRKQGLTAFHNAFGNDAAAVSGSDPQPNARILIATYQTLDIDTDDAGADFLEANYPPNYFSHIVIDECHRSAWGEWSKVLTRNPNAVQIGLTATPRELDYPRTHDAAADEEISADNIRHFGEPVYEYDIGQGIEDGYLAACEIVRRDVFLEDSPFPERETGLGRDDLWSATIADARTGELLTAAETRERYQAGQFEARLLLPERVQAMTNDLFDRLLETGGPEQKTIVFCARDQHADAVAIALNNRYARWCAETTRKPADPYAFKCTAASHGSDYLADLRGASRSYFIATTVDLLTTGVDVPNIRNIVFFKYVRSPIAFYQMIGRGTRLDPATGKLMFRVYDYTAATRLFGEAFRTKATIEREPGEPPTPAEAPEKVIQVEGIDVHVADAGIAIVTSVDGATKLVTLEEYKERIATSLLGRASTLDAFRALWIAPPARGELIAGLPDAGRSASVVRAVEEMADFDLYDVLAELGYGLEPKTRIARADAFDYKAADWLADLPPSTAATLRALARQFARAGTDELEDRGIFETPDVRQAGGLAALKLLGSAADILRATKERLFAA
ncbi:MAG: DEAD/DEAH box helicase family protein [Chloroflexi bacterium]|nr:DEAD/DEAH box helicase family protein [Chloroflexota bacterium]